jgi:hypothetical protein
MVNLEDLKQSLVNEWSSIHPDLLTSHYPDKYYSDIQEEIITPHPHVRVVTHFADTQIFQKLISQVNVGVGLSRDEVREKYNLIKEKLEKIDKVTKDIDPKDFTANDILPYIDILARHIISEGYEANGKIRFLTRFGSHRIHRPDIQQRMLQVLDDMYLLYTHQDDIETGGVKPVSTWHEVMTCCWAFIEGGFIEHTRFVVDTLINVTEKIQEHQPANRIFKLWEVPDKTSTRDYRKHLRSTYAVAGPFYAAIGETDKAIDIFNRSINLFDKIVGYTEKNRVVEHAIELYKIQPTEENRLRAIEMFIEHKNGTPHEPTETVREAGVIALMLLQDVFKVVIP